MTVRWSALLIGTLLAAPSSLAVAASADAGVERSLNQQAAPNIGMFAPYAASATMAHTAPVSIPPAHGITDPEIHFGMVMPFSGTREARNYHDIELE